MPMGKLWMFFFLFANALAFFHELRVYYQSEVSNQPFLSFFFSIAVFNHLLNTNYHELNTNYSKINSWQINGSFMIIHVRKKIMISKFLLFEIGGVIRLPSHRRLIFIHNAVSVWTKKIKKTASLSKRHQKQMGMWNEECGMRE